MPEQQDLGGRHEAPGQAQDQAVSLLEIASVFSRIGVTSFGGGLSAWIYRETVDHRRWLTEDEFLSGLTLAQILPGANVVNLSIYIGQRLQGAIGSVVAVCSLLIPPMVIVVALAAVLHRYGNADWIHQLLQGVAAGAIGMTISVGIRTARRSAAIKRWPLLLIAAIFVTIGVLSWPMVPVVLALTPFALALAWRSR